MYGIMRFKKYKRAAVYGIEQERCRESDSNKVFAASDIYKTQTCYNVSMVSCDEGFNKKINRIIASHGCKARKDSVVMIGAVFTASSEYFDRNPDYVEGSGAPRWLRNEKTMSFFNDCLSEYIDIMCHGDSSLVIHARIDLDETTPHLQIYSVPIVKAEEGYKLCAKELVGNRADLRHKQDLFHKHVGMPRGLSRGDKVDWDMTPAEQKRHKETIKYKQEQSKTLDEEIDRKKAKIARIDALETEAKEKYGTAIKNGSDAYATVVGKYNGLCEKYKELAEAYNNKAAEYNEKAAEIKEIEGRIQSLEEVPAIQAKKNENKIKAISRVVVGNDEYGNVYNLNEFIDAVRKHSRDMDDFQSKMSYVMSNLNRQPIREIWDNVCGIQRNRTQERVR